MRNLLAELRMLLADTLLGWAVKIAPAQHADGLRLVQYVQGYLRDSIARRRGEG